MAHTDKAIAFVNELKETCYIEQLPLSATDYIYKDATQKKHLLNNRILKGEEVKRRGYMSIAKKELRIKIFKNKIRGLFIDLKNRLLS